MDRQTLVRASVLLRAAAKAIEDQGYDMDFTYVDGIETDHIGFATDCENAASRLDGLIEPEC